MNEQCYPENVEEIRRFAKEIKLDVKYLLGEKYEGDSYLPSVESLPENIKFNVGGSLDLSYVKSLPDNVIFNVGGYLWMPSVKSLSANIVFNVGDWLVLYSVKSLSNNIVFNIGGKIYLPTKHKVKVDWS